jgi:hydrogenase expression/formation protein
MVDLEVLAKKCLERGLADEEIVKKLVDEILFYKSYIKDFKAEELAKALVREIKNSLKAIDNEFLREIVSYPESSITIGLQGAGIRGIGDFFVHRKIAEITSVGPKAYLDPRSQDDAGAVRLSSSEIIVAHVDGVHPRLGEYPFLSGFHVTRAVLRDIYVKGAKPLGLLIDIHLADDADVGKLFDFIAGCATIAQLANVPILAGSTLRIGEDIVLGTGFTGGVAAVALAKNPLLVRRNIKPGDLILMTEGSGGGTITAASIFSGNFDVILETLNINFIKACEAIFEEGIINKIHAMADWTNGGLKGDSHEICQTANVGLIFYEEVIRDLLNPKILALLKKLNIDYLGVSMDALVIFTSPNDADLVLKPLKRKGIKADIVGQVVENPKVGVLISDKGKQILTPSFREVGYTATMKVFSEELPQEYNQMLKKLEEAKQRSIEKSKKVINFILNKKALKN